MKEQPAQNYKSFSASDSNTHFRTFIAVGETSSLLCIQSSEQH